MFSTVSNYVKRFFALVGLRPSHHAKKHDLELGQDMSDIKSKKVDETSRWAFWNLYIREGLGGSVFNLLWLNPIALILMCVEIIANSLSTYAMTALTTQLTNLVVIENSQQTTASLPNPAPLNLPPVTPSIVTNQSTTMLILMIIAVLFTNNITTLIKRLLRGRSMFYKYQIIRKIETVVVDQVMKTSPETDSEVSLDDKEEAFNRFIWVYDNITDTMVELTVQTVRSLTFCMYVVYVDIRMIPVYAIVYYLVWRYVIPQTSQKNTKGGDGFWQRSYYDLVVSESLKTNPLYGNLYAEKKDTDGTATFNSEMPNVEQLIKADAEKSLGGRVVHPDIVERYMETIRYYSMKHMDWSDSNEKLVVARNAVNLVIIIFMLWTSQYSMALIILINRSSMFGLFDTYSDMKRIEQGAEKSMEKLIKILNTVDEQAKKGEIRKTQVIDASTDSKVRRRISTITIDDLSIVIPAQKKENKAENENKETDEESETQGGFSAPVNYNRSIDLSHVKLDIKPNKCLLLDGHTGCGKSMTINTIAGHYSKKVCRSMMVGFTDGSILNAEFNEIMGSRCYVGQMLSDEYKCNGKIAMPMFSLFPGASNIGEVTNFLMGVFKIKRDSIPTSLSDSPHSKLSGGEIQRYVVASQVWKALRIKPDIMILDEVDRALDKETAVHVMSWIIDNVDSFFVIVSHLTEVKQMLIAKKCITQIWSYDDTSDRYHIKVIPRLV